METIQLNIDKALSSVTKEQVFAYEKEVAESMENYIKVLEKGMIFWDGYICRHLLQTLIFQKLRLQLSN